MDINTIKKIASLARLGTDEKEEKSLKEDLSMILNYIEKLGEVDTKDVEPLYQITGLVNSTREDIHRGDFKNSDELLAKLVGQAPANERGFVKVKSILNK